MCYNIIIQRTCCWRNDANQNIFADVCAGVHVKFNAMNVWALLYCAFQITSIN